MRGRPTRRCLAGGAVHVGLHPAPTSGRDGDLGAGRPRQRALRGGAGAKLTRATSSIRPARSWPSTTS